MSYYDLFRLNPDSFEQLVQALARSILGPGIRIFGAGPDGAREATFEGEIELPPKPKWRGYGVVQAKFKAKAEGTSKDTRWALNQLKSELKKFKDPERKLRKPDYYIFVTNVALSSVAGKGGKDKADALMQKNQKALGIKDWDLWDGDKLTTLLDGNREVRTRFAAFVTPGDVLARVMEWIDWQGDSPADFDRVMTHLMQKELLADLNARLEQSGHSDLKIPLNRVFIDLTVSNALTAEPPQDELEDGRLAPGFLTTLLDVGNRSFAPEFVGAEPTSIAEPDTGLRPRGVQGRFVLVGGPGQGKSTLCQFLTQVYRVALLDDRKNLLPEAREAVTQFLAECGNEGIPIPTTRRFPIRIVLRRFADDLATGKARSLLSYISNRIADETDHEIAPRHFRRWLGTYPWILLLDGLDEVPASSNRTQVLEAVRGFLIEGLEVDADILVLATTRPQSYNQDFPANFYQHYYLTPLSSARGLYYGRRLAENRYEGDGSRIEDVVARLDRAAAQPTTARLMRSPLQVTIMATLVAQHGDPPTDNWRLFKEYYETIYRRERERGILDDILAKHQNDVDVIHRQVGLALQTLSERTGGSESTISYAEFEKLVALRLEERYEEERQVEELQRQILEAVTDRLVFLVSPRPGHVGFEIRSLQEFMAAECLMQDPRVAEKRLRAVAPVSHWRAAFRFMAGRCFSDANSEYFQQTVYDVCAGLNEDPDRLQRSSLAGSQLALELLEDGAVRSSPRYSRMLARLALRLLELPPDDLHDRLGQVCSPNLVEIFQEELGKRFKLHEIAEQLPGWQTLIKLRSSGSAWADPILEEAWPHDPNIAAEILELEPIANSEWLLPRIVQLILRLPFARVRALAYRLASKDPTGFFTLLRRPLHGARLYVRLLERGDDGFSISFSRIDSDLTEVLIFAQPIEEPSGWSVLFLSALRFSESPNRETLSRELRWIASVSDSADALEFPTSLLPWPLGSILATSHTGDALLLMADRVERGELGDYDDWRAAERRWLTEGITHDDFISMTDRRVPYDQTIREVGIPLGTFSYSIRGSEKRFHQGMKLLKWSEEAQGGRVKRFLSEGALFVLEDSHAFSESSVALAARTAYADTKWITLSPNIIQAVLNLDADEALELLDQFGCKPYLYLNTLPPDEIVLKMSDLFSKNPRRLGLLRILAACATAGAKTALPGELVDWHRYDQRQLLLPVDDNYFCRFATT